MDGLQIKNVAFREFLAELLGTFVLTAIGCCCNAAGHFNSSNAPLGAIGWGMALTAAIYVCGGVSGGHVNPAVTIGMAAVGKLKWAKVPLYFLGQYIGAFLGAVVTFGVYYQAINEASEGDLFSNKTAGIFGTIPSDKLWPATGFFDQVVCVSFFLLIICAICDEKNMGIQKGLIPIAIGLFDLGLMVIAFGYNCGAPINPARDLMPRLFTTMAGWGSYPFSVNDYNYFWIPILAPHIGGIIGCWIYKLFIEFHIPSQEYNVERTYVEMSVKKNEQHTA